MKRVHLAIDENLLEEAARLSGSKTLSGAVNKALRDFVERARARGILTLTGSGLWDGQVSLMRGDRSRRRPIQRGPTGSV